MPERFKKVCNEPGCIVRTSNRGGYCDQHQKDNSRKRRTAAYDKERHSDPISKLYNAVWDKTKLMLRGRGNVICQKLENGKQCTRPSEIYHHLVSPRENPALMYVPRNVVGLCQQHHPPDEGTPWWKEGVDYVKTIWSDPVVG
jgi:hypothetical protein